MHELYRSGLNVPPGFIITTETCIDFLSNELKTPIINFCQTALSSLETKTGRVFGLTSESPENLVPLLVSVRYGAAVDMPRYLLAFYFHNPVSMMDTILNVGINDEIVRRLAIVTGNQRFALNVQMKFLFLWGTVVMGKSKETFVQCITKIMKEENVTRECWLSPLGIQRVISEFKKVGNAPDDPLEQLQIAIQSIFRSWQCPR